MSNRVDYFIVGAMKSGTSSLRDYLRQYPDVDMYKGEIHYFSKSSNFKQGLDWYKGHFDFEGAYALHGEKSPPYGIDPKVAERIHEYNPDAKILWILRDPVERAISHFYHAKKRNPDSMSLEESLANAEDLAARNHVNAYAYRSQYDRHLAYYEKLFGKERNFVCIFEEVVASPETEMRKVTDFLGIEFRPEATFPHSNVAPDGIRERFSISEKGIADLRLALAPTIDTCEAHLGRSIPSWRGQ